MNSAFAADRIQRQSNRRSLRGRRHFVPQVVTINQDHVAAVGSEFLHEFRASNNIDGLVSQLTRDLNGATSRRRICRVLNHPVARLERNEVVQHSPRGDRIHF